MATARKMSFENLRNCDYLRLSNLVCVTIFGKVRYHWIDVRAVKLNRVNRRFAVVDSSCQ